MANYNLSLKNLSIKVPNRDLSMAAQAGQNHPFIKGYFYIFFRFPKIVTSLVGRDNGSDVNNILLSLCEGYTPPGDRQLKLEDIQGMGGVDSSFVTGQTIDRNFSLQFRELWGSPIMKIHRAWTSIIDPLTGGLDISDDSPLGELKDTIQFSPEFYKGKIIIVQTKPILSFTATNVEKAIVKVDAMKGVVPTMDLNSVYDSNITDNSIVKPNVTYRFDGAKIDDAYDPKLIDYAVSLLKDLSIARNLDKYNIEKDL